VSSSPVLASSLFSTVVSHHTHMCAPAAAYIVVLGEGSVLFAGDRPDFEQSSFAEQYLGGHEEKEKPKEKKIIKLTNKRLNLPGTQASPATSDVSSSEMDSSSDDDDDVSISGEKKAPRKLVEDEKRSTGQIAWRVWMAYFSANGHVVFWAFFVAVFLAAEFGEVGETLVLRCARMPWCA
jgi:hypothetical protein